MLYESCNKVVMNQSSPVILQILSTRARFWRLHIFTGECRKLEGTCQEAWGGPRGWGRGKCYTRLREMRESGEIQAWQPQLCHGKNYEDFFKAISKPERQEGHWEKLAQIYPVQIVLEQLDCPQWWSDWLCRWGWSGGHSLPGLEQGFQYSLRPF